MSGISILALGVLCSSLVNAVFRLFGIYKIDKLQAVVVNYLICFIIGLLITGDQFSSIWNQTWYIASFFLGLLFILIFICMAYTTEIHGISINALSSKLAVVIPVAYASIILHESFNMFYFGGIALSLLSIWLITFRRDQTLSRFNKLLPLIVFIGSGLVDLSLKLMNKNFGHEASSLQISYGIFSGAFAFGSLALIWKGFRYKKRIELRNVFAGILLGIPNYFSIALLMAAIHAYRTQSAFVFGVYNIGVVFTSALISILFFAERLNRIKTVGLILAILAVFLITYGKR